MLKSDHQRNSRYCIGQLLQMTNDFRYLRRGQVVEVVDNTKTKIRSSVFTIKVREVGVENAKPIDVPTKYLKVRK